MHFVRVFEIYAQEWFDKHKVFINLLSIPIVIAEQYDHKVKLKIKYSKIYIGIWGM